MSTTNTTTAVADRAEIEKLARELTDDVWSFVLKEPGSGIHAMAFCQACIAAGFREAPSPREIIAALLAYLDEVIAEADRRPGKPGHQEWLRSLPEPMRKAVIRRSKEASR